MMKVVTGQEMQELESQAIEALNLSVAQLMDRAGAAVAKAAASKWVNVGGKKVVILCGSGHNGGDGLVAGALLAEQGATVIAIVLAKEDELKQETAAALRHLKTTSAMIVYLPDRIVAKSYLETADLVVDCIFGFGFRGIVPNQTAEIIEAVNEASVEVLAVDIPSGIEADSGHIHGPAIRAGRTIAFTLPKIGNIVDPGAQAGGSLDIIDIGISGEVNPSFGRVNILDRTEVAAMLPVHRVDIHKHSRGKVLVIGGSVGMTGAATLTAQAALRSGAGIVTAAVPASLNPVFEIKLTEVMTAPMPETPSQSLALQAFDDIAELAGSFDVIAIGPGLSLDPSTVALVRRIVAEIDLPMVIDADALNALIGETKKLKSRTSPTILTPHPKELARLLKVAVEDIQSQRIDLALEAAARWGAIIVLKGAKTIAALPAGQSFVNPTGNKGMATAGTGDVLTGIISALLSQTKEPLSSSVLGCHIHGLAGDMAASQLTEYCLVAHDIIDALPRAFKELSEAQKG